MDIFYSYIQRKKNKEKSMSLRVAEKTWELHKFIYIAEGVQRAINPQHHENLNWPNQSHQKQMSLYELQVHKTKLGD